jgi:hypothetical protein
MKMYKKWWFWVGWAIVNAIAVGLAWMYPLKLAMFLLGQIILVMVVNKRKRDEFWVVVGGTLGPIAEILAIGGGAWEYTAPYFFGIPIWLPLLWGLAALFGRRVVEELK